MAVVLVCAETDGKHLRHRADILMALGWERRRRFAQRGVEELGDDRRLRDL